MNRTTEITQESWLTSWQLFRCSRHLAFALSVSMVQDVANWVACRQVSYFPRKRQRKTFFFFNPIHFIDMNYETNCLSQESHWEYNSCVLNFSAAVLEPLGLLLCCVIQAGILLTLSFLSWLAHFHVCGTNFPVFVKLHVPLSLCTSNSWFSEA